MRPYDIDKLQYILDDDLTWRRREISDLITIAQTGRVGERRTARRASIPMMYAHWEGYTKNSFVRYFEFVSLKRKKFSDLSSNFMFLSSRKEIGSISSADAEAAIAKFNHVLDKVNLINTDPMRKHVNTRSNLRWDVLTELYAIAGIEQPSIDLETTINVSLCDARNAIAHGESAAPDLDAVRQLRDDVFLMLESVKNSLVTAAANEDFLRRSSASA